MPPTFLLADMSSRASFVRVALSAQPHAPVRTPLARRGLRRRGGHHRT
jgi:hypothetical protein